MKIIPEESLIFENEDKRLEIKFSPELYEQKLPYEASDYTLAKLLIWLKSFNKFIQNARISLEISKPIIYPQNASTDGLIKTITSFTKGKGFDNLRTEVARILKYYKLPERWDFSTMCAILMNTLLVPPRELPISIYLPRFLPKGGNKPIKDLTKLSSIFDDPAYKRMQMIIKLSEHPCIYFNQNISPNELRDWVTKNTKLIEDMVSNLPEKKDLRIQERTYFWGQVVWILRKEGTKSWVKIWQRIDEMDDQESSSDKEDPIFYPIPEEVELRLAYKSFLKSLRKIEPR